MSKKRDRSKPFVLLVNPARRFRYNWDLQEVARVMGSRTATHPLALPLIASLTPPRFEVRIADEEIEPIAPWLTAARKRDAAREPWIVGITSLVSNVKRALELADAFRSAGCTVVLGGPQTSVAPEPSLAHADAVVVGEAEGVWERVLDDALAGKLERAYRAETWCEFRTSPKPRWDLVDRGRILTFGVQASRGCRFHCDFCLVRALFGAKQRYRDVEDVLDEIRTLPPGIIAFADDNLTADRAFARALMRGLAPLGRQWSCQASVDLASDEELVHEMARAGCNSVLIGFESLDERNLKQMHKSQNRIDRYRAAIDLFHSAGIHIIASFVVGFDADDADTFAELERFIRETRLSYVMINALNAFPGTELHEVAQSGKKLLDIDTDLVTGLIPNLAPANMTTEDLFLSITAALGRIYAPEAMLEKALSLLSTGWFARSAGGDPGALAKLRTMAFLLRRHVLTKSATERRLFLELMKLGRNGRADMSQVVSYLLFVDSFRGYLDFIRGRRDEILGIIRAAEEKATAVPDTSAERLR